MTKKALVAYASGYGMATGIAEAIGEVLRESGMAVDVLSVKKVKDIKGYDAVVVGSSVRAGNWLRRAKGFVEKHRDALSKLPVAYFVVCLTLKEDTEENRQAVAAYLDPLYEAVPEVQPVDVGLFAGGFLYDKLNFFDKMILKKMESPEGDFRDWDAVKAWAGQVRPKLLET